MLLDNASGPLDVPLIKVNLFLLGFLGHCYPGQTIFYTKMIFLQKSVDSQNPIFHVFRESKYNKQSLVVIWFIKIRFLKKSH